MDCCLCLFKLLAWLPQFETLFVRLRKRDQFTLGGKTMENACDDKLILPLLHYSSESGCAIQDSSSNGTMKVTSLMLKIRGIKCNSCVSTIETSLRKLKGVESVVLTLQGQSIIRHWPELISAKSIKEAIYALGFDVIDFPEEHIAICHFRVKGMSCTSCCESLERALLMVDGVEKAMISFTIGEARVHFNPNSTDACHLINIIGEAGFEADVIRCCDGINKTQLTFEVHSSEPLIMIKSYLESTEGVYSVDVDSRSNNVRITYDSNIIGPRSLMEYIQQVDACRFRGSLHIPVRRKETESDQEIRICRNDFLWSCLFAVPVFFFSMALPMVQPYGNWLRYKIHNMLTIGMLIRCVLCTPVQFIIGRRFYAGSYHALKLGSANMDVLVALGTNAAYFYSVYILMKSSASDSFQSQDLFETSAMLISFILLGKYLEVMAKGRTSYALNKLTDLAPSCALLLEFDECGNVLSETEISTQLIQRNDVIKILPGTRVPVDGVVIRGQSHVNESMITGEATPIFKRPGDKVIGGTMNENGFLLVEVTHVGSETTLSQIVRLVETAQFARAPVQKLADQISHFFVPVVVIAACLTWLGWLIAGEASLYPSDWIPTDMDGFELALQFGISVLVIACPCALGLATPTAVMVATGKGASLGILIKSGSILQKAGSIGIIVFDKTGTVTIGKPTVINTVLFCNMKLTEFVDLTATVEGNSEHPLAKAIVTYAKKVHQQQDSWLDLMKGMQDFEVHPGAGVCATVADRVVFMGNRRLMQAHQIPISPDVEAYLRENERLTYTCVLVAVDGKIVGAFAVTDPVKPEANRVVSLLEEMSIQTIMMTGDNLATATAVANEAGISSVIAEMDPMGKAEKIKELQTSGQIVAMIGDGINDAPALVAADVGIAIGAGTDVAIDAADVVLVKDNLEEVITAIDLSKRSLYRIKMNYVWALGYNVMGVPIAAGALYPFTGIRLPPWLAGVCMAASSISVVCSSLLLQTYRKPLI